MSFLSPIADIFSKQIAARVKGYLQDYVKDYGRLTELHIDFSSKTVICSVELDGEDKPITAIIKGIAVSKDDDKSHLTFESIELSRPWMNQLSLTYLPVVMKDKPLELPGTIAFILRRVF